MRRPEFYPFATGRTRSSEEGWFPSVRRPCSHRAAACSVLFGIEDSFGKLNSLRALSKVPHLEHLPALASH